MRVTVFLNLLTNVYGASIQFRISKFLWNRKVSFEYLFLSRYVFKFDVYNEMYRSSFVCTKCMKEHLYEFDFFGLRPIDGYLISGMSNLLFWERATVIIVGWFAGRACKNYNKFHTQLPKLLCNFYSIIVYIITNVAA
jgi:hypothetical protein